MDFYYNCLAIWLYVPNAGNLTNDIYKISNGETI